jgi:hypothetical protein
LKTEYFENSMSIFSFLTRQARLPFLALTCALLTLVASCAQANDTTLISQPATTTSVTAPRALWVWNAGVITQQDARTQLFEFCRAKNISILYVHLGDFLSDKKRDENDVKHVTKTSLGDFLAAAHAQNIRVEALDGDPSFARATQHESALRRLELALDYNRTAPAVRRLDGFQWDIEPYVLKEFKDETQHDAVLGEFLDIVKKSRDMVQDNLTQNTDFRLGFALPFWMDSEAQSIAWNGEKKPATFHVLEILKSLPQAYVALMAYRDKADGDGGSVAVVRGEIEYAAQHAPNVKIVVGQETGAVKGDPPSITFYEEGEGALETALVHINAAYGASPVYGGVAIHHLDSYRDLIARLPQKASPVTGEVSLHISSPEENDRATLETTVSGKASGGASVQISVMPEGDIWYDRPPIALGSTGDWSTPIRIGNDKTPAGRRFKIRVRLLNEAGTVLQEKQISVARK